MAFPRRVHADVIATRYRRRRRCVRCSVSRSSCEGRPLCFPATPSSGLACELRTARLWKRGRLSDASRLSTTRRRRSVATPARQPGVHCAPPFGASPGRAEPNVSSQSGGESPRVRGKKTRRRSPQTCFPLRSARPRIVIDIISVLPRQYVVL